MYRNNKLTSRCILFKNLENSTRRYKNFTWQLIDAAELHTLLRLNYLHTFLTLYSLLVIVCTTRLKIKVQGFAHSMNTISLNKSHNKHGTWTYCTSKIQALDIKSRSAYSKHTTFSTKDTVFSVRYEIKFCTWRRSLLFAFQNGVVELSEGFSNVTRVDC